MPLKPFTETILLSYPRSGNHLFRQLIEEISQQNTHSIYPEDPFPMAGSLRGRSRSGNVYKTHRISHFRSAGFSIDPTKSKLLLLLRDPYECVASDMSHHPKAWRMCITYIQLRKYLENIAYFRAYPGEKLSLYYETFHTAPQDLIQPLTGFLGVEAVEANVDPDTVAQAGLKSLERKATSHRSPTHYRDQNFLGWKRLWAPQRCRELLAPYRSIRYLPW